MKEFYILQVKGREGTTEEMERLFRVKQKAS
jgi:hypothetical protein